VLVNNSIFDVVVVGAGHAGIEAALASSRAGSSTAIITMDRLAVGRLSCNPAIGGLGKGHLVKEIDALGGIMGLAADKSSLQFKTLNKSKGRAVWSTRAQIDKKTYPLFIQKHLSQCKNITIIEGEVVDFSVDNNAVSSAILKDGTKLKTKALIVSSGTFLNGKIHIGGSSYAAGRYGELPANYLGQNLVKKGFISSRLKTGTPPRLRSSSINWNVAVLAPGEDNPAPFSYKTPSNFKAKNIPCHIVDTNKAVHEILADNLTQSPMFSGKISAAGPRYCPSIEDKIVRFKNRHKHQLFLEPEWFGSEQIYLNGFSTSMPEEVQIKALKQISALKNVELIRPGYAIEYDYFPTYQLRSTLESKNINGLYFAGQLNGTSGYEEAAAQGLIAGANASLKIQNKEPLTLRRDQAYIGVLIDDLITKEIDEPYRMFTSSAEFRLSLRNDNVQFRLSEIGFDAGLVDKKDFLAFTKYRDAVNKLMSYCYNEKTKLDGKSITLSEYIKRPENSINDNHISTRFISSFSEKEMFIAETNIKYEGYINIELSRIKKIKRIEDSPISPLFDYSKIKNLSSECVQKLKKIKPETLGQASRLAGVRPSDIAIIAMHIKSSL